MQKLITITELSGLSKRSADSIRRDADSGKLQAVRIGRERAFEQIPALLYAVNHRFGLALRQIDKPAAAALSKAVLKSSSDEVADGFSVIQAFALACDEPEQLEIAAAVSQVLPPRAFNPSVHDQS